MENSVMRRYLAPMEGITAYVFRAVYHSVFGGMDKYFTPFLSPNQTGKLGPRELRDLLPENNRGMCVVPQILTNSAQDFIRTAKTVRSMGYEEVNLNLGCPSSTVTAKKRGAGFLAYPEEVDRCLYDIFAGLDMKISVKTRLGMKDPQEFETLLDIYNKYPMEELIIHPRIREDHYRNTPRMEVFARAFARSVNPVCYNGDLFGKKDLEKLKEEFPRLPAVMLGRGIAAYPGLLFAGADPGKEKERLRRFHDCLYEAYCAVYLKEAGPKVVLFKMKEIWCYLIFAFQDSEKPGKRIKKASQIQEYEAAVAAIFRQCQVVPGGRYRGTP